MNFQPLKDYLDKICNVDGLPVCECRVIHKGEVVFDHQAGKYDKDRNMYFMYSMTKPTTSALIMILVEKGILSLEDTVDKYLPEYAEMTYKKDGEVLPCKNKMTLYNLITMQGGYGYDFDSDGFKKMYADKPNATNRDVAYALSEDPLEYEPGEGFQYSLCYDVFPAIVEVATGRAYEDVIREYIFEPLGMTRSTFKYTPELAKEIADFYSYNGEKQCLEKLESNLKYRFNSDETTSGGAGLMSCMDDYAKFAFMLSNKGVSLEGKRILSEESIDLMRRNHMKDITKYPRASQGYAYGFGFRVLMNNSACESNVPVGEFEVTGAAGSLGLFNTMDNIAIVFIEHVLGFPGAYGEHHFKVRDLAYQGLGFGTKESVLIEY